MAALFLIFLAVLFRAGRERRMATPPLADRIRVVGRPFGTFVFDRSLRREIAEVTPIAGKGCRGETDLVGPRLRCVEQMPAGGAETERLQELLRDLRRVDLREPEGPHALRAESREQLLQTGSTVLDERAERHNLRLLRSALQYSR